MLSELQLACNQRDWLYFQPSHTSGRTTSSIYSYPLTNKSKSATLVTKVR